MAVSNSPDMNGERLTLYPDRHRGGCELLEDRIREAATQLWRSQELTDIELRASDGDIIHAHRLVLVTESAYFRALFCGKFRVESTVDLCAISSSALHIVLEYLYTNSCTLDEGSLSAVLEAAAFLQVPALLKDLCAEVQDRLLPSNAFEWWARSAQLELPTLVAPARAAALRGWEADGSGGPASETLGALPMTSIIDLASSGKVCAPEEALSRAVNTWLACHRPVSAEDEARVRSALVDGAAGRARRRRMQSGRGLVLMVGGQAKHAFGGCYAASTVVECYDARHGTWSAHAPLQVARRDAAAINHDGDVYVLGGKVGFEYLYEDTTEYVSSVELLEQYSEKDEWRQVAPLSIPRACAAAASMDGSIYCLGGEVLLGQEWSAESGSVRLTSSVERYDPANGRWEWAPPMQRVRTEAAAVVLSGHLYVIGGFVISHAQESSVRHDARDGYPELRAPAGQPPAFYRLGHKKATRTVEYFDGQIWRDAPPLTKLCGSLTAITYDDKIYVTGVADGESSSVECYDPSVGRWVEVTVSDTCDVPRDDDDDEDSPPIFPSGVPAGTLDGRLCLVDRDRDHLAQFWCFDIDDASWERLPRADGSFKHRSGFCAVVVY